MTPEVFPQVNSMLGGRSFEKTHPRRVSSQYLLSGIARCGHCGKALIGLEAKSGQFAYYVCGGLTKKGSGACPAKYQNSKKLENLVVSQIKEKILTTENLSDLASE
jgi:hypothetical protein